MSHMRSILTAAILALPTWAAAQQGAATLPAQPPQQSTEALAKAVQNPVADIVSVPLQNNTNFRTGVGGEDASNTLNIQPVIPIGIGPVNLITRTILPVVYLPQSLTGTSDDAFGLGDLQFTAFLSPAKPGAVIWGIGPIFSFPTGTSDSLTTESFGIGPSAVVLMMPGKWVFGLIVSQLWSFAGSADRRPINQTSVQYFVNYNLAHGWYISSAPILTGNWEIKQGNQWTVPFGMGVGKLHRIGKLPVNFLVQGFYNAVRPEKAMGGSEATLRAQLQFVLPSFF
jgi:hypothetical protein